MAVYLLKKIFYPEIFQGGYKKKNYFEGWYYKIIDNKMENAFAVIPGVSYGKSREDSHAFIQVLNSRKRKVSYFKYDISSFSYDKKRFGIEIGGSCFSDKEISLNIRDSDFSVNGKLSFKNAAAYPKTILHPGIMGPYSFVPFMECYHGIVNIHHNIIGNLNVCGNKIDFNGGYGYIEKDWGRSFPEAWIWLQSNHFSTGDVSVMFSTAKIPWFGRYFIGFISFIRIKDKIHLFSTYTKAVIERLNYLDNRLNVVLRHRQAYISVIFPVREAICIAMMK
jgi:tocopherol cyclase